MDLHLHLSVAFRALDRKWGKPIDLDTPEEMITCVPAVVDIDTTTFSSEEFLKAVRRNRIQHYPQIGERRKSKISNSDSFSNISVTRSSSTSDFYGSEEILADLKVQTSDESVNTEEIAAKNRYRKKKGLGLFKQSMVSALFNIKKKIK